MTLNFHVEKGLNRLFENYLTGPKSYNANYAIKRAVANWSTRQNDCCFANLFYRIGQAILTIFGKSDWQVAKNYMRDAILENVNKGIATWGFPLNITDDQLAGDQRKLIDKIHVKFLEILVKFNDKDFLENQPIDPQFSMEVGLDLIKFSGDLCQEFMPTMQTTVQGLQMAKMMVRSQRIGLKSLVDYGIKTITANGFDLKAWLVQNPGPYNVNGITPRQVINQVSPILGAIGIDAQRIANKVLTHLSNSHNINIQI